jgi:GT2 family glycosyltransferase
MGGQALEKRRSGRVTSSVDVAVVVVTWNSGDVVGDLLAALPAALDGCGTWSVVVVDNSSSDRTSEVVSERAPWALWVQTGGNLGYAAAINRGLRSVPATAAVVVCNADVVPAAGSVARLLAAADEPGIGIAAPRLVGADGRQIWSLRRNPTVLRALGEAVAGGRAGRVTAFGEVERRAAAYARPATVDWASGAFLLLTPQCRSDVGDWDESFFLYSEETDFAQRARRAGHRVSYVPAAVVVHREGESGTSPELYALMIRNKVRLYQRQHGRAAAWAFRTALGLGELARVRRGPVHRAALRELVGRAAPTQRA